MEATNKIRYPLASAPNRFFAKLLDYVLILLVVISLSVLVIINDPSGIENVNNLQQTWRYFVCCLIAFLLFITYFIIVPYVWKGKTVFFFLFKIAIINTIPTKNMLFSLFKRELLVWFFFASISLIFSVVLMSFNQQDAHNLLTQLVSFKSDSINYVVYIFQALYMVSGLILLLVVLNLFILNKKQALIDKISNTVTIKLNASLITPDGNANVKTSKAKRNYGLPGEIHEGFEEIDKL